MPQLFSLIILLVTAVSASGATKLSANCDHLPDKERNDCEATFEQELGLQYSKYFERNGDNLVLKAEAEGGSMTFTNIPSSSFSDYGDHYRLVAFYPDLKISHIRVSGWENFQSFVFQHTYGTVKNVLWKVVISPNDKLLVGFNGDIETGWSQNGVAIYSIDLGLNPLVSYYPDAFGITDIKFVDSKEIGLTTTCYAENADTIGPHIGTAKLKLSDSVWQIGQISCNE